LADDAPDFYRLKRPGKPCKKASVDKFFRLLRLLQVPGSYPDDDGDCALVAEALLPVLQAEDVRESELLKVAKAIAESEDPEVPTIARLLMMIETVRVHEDEIVAFCPEEGGEVSLAFVKADALAEGEELYKPGSPEALLHAVQETINRDKTVFRLKIK
jgi:hypothetical protein